MIEWIRFDEWDLDTKGSYLVSYQRHGCTCYSVVCDRNELINFAKLSKIEYITSINRPVEKTLEEKFEEFRVEANKVNPHVYDLKVYTYCLAQIAKQHYEGEK